MIFTVICQVQQWQYAYEVKWGELELSCCLESWHGDEWGILHVVLVLLVGVEIGLGFRCVCKGVKVGKKFPVAESLSQYCKSLICEITNWLLTCETTLVRANFNWEFQGSFKIHTLITNLKGSCFFLCYVLFSWLVGVNHGPRTTCCLFLFHNWLICQKAVNVGLIHFDREIEICIRPYRLLQPPLLFPYWQAVKG